MPTACSSSRRRERGEAGEEEEAQDAEPEAAIAF